VVLHETGDQMTRPDNGGATQLCDLLITGGRILDLDIPGSVTPGFVPTY
jgi:hypothetical protein